MEKVRIAMKSIWDTTKERVKLRYIFLLALAVITIFFSFLYKDLKYRENFEVNNGKKQIILDEEVKEDIVINYNKPKEVCIKVGKNNPVSSTKYNVSLANGNEEIVNIDINTQDLQEEQLISLSLPELYNIKGKQLTLRIKSDNKDKENALVLYTSSVNSNGMIVNNDETSNGMYIRVEYPKFGGIYLIVVSMLFIASCGLILFIDLKQIHNGVFAVILTIGFFIVILNPILDTPDDHAHLARTDLTSRGILFVTGDITQYKVSNSVKDILNDGYLTIENTSLFNSKIDNDANYVASNYANTNLFIGYIPQTLGVLVAKIFTGSSMFILILGKLFNLIAFSLMVRFAIKMTPIFKVPIGIISMMPMSLFIASSFNPDATTYGLGFLVISYFLYLYKKENITIKDIAIYTVLSILLGLVKLPYCALGGLIIFLPKSKFKDNKTYYKSFLFVFLIAIVSLGWGVTAMINSAVSPFNSFYETNNIDTKQQVMYIMSHPITFVKAFSVALLDNIRTYTDQLTRFGWLSYGFSAGSALLSVLFIGSVVVLYPNEEELCKKTKYGIVIVGLATYVATSLILYLSWTPVGSSSINGVQGRYFIPLIALLTLLSSGKKYNDETKLVDFKFIFISLIFLAIFVITMMNRYY
jgi:uncharacterized membrane protein